MDIYKNFSKEEFLPFKRTIIKEIEDLNEEI